MSINIGFDGSRSFVEKPSGTEVYSKQIMVAIASELRQDSMCVFTRGKYDSVLVNGVKNIQIKNQRLWTQFGLAVETWRRNLDVLFIPAHVVPFLKRPSLPVVVTVHDLRTEFLPQHSSLIQKIYLNRITEWFRGHFASHIIAVSESTKKDIISKLGVPSDKVTVIYEGYDRKIYNFEAQANTKAVNQVKEKYRCGGDYILFVGTVQPRKNLVRLIEAYAQSEGKKRGIKLVIAGNKGWLADEIYAKPGQLGIEGYVQFLNYVDLDDMPFLYAGAKAFVFPSLYEGFGLPILEALACGTPVLTSNIASMPEVGGNQAHYVNPCDVDDIRDGINTVIDHKLDQEMLQKHLAKYSWEKAGQESIEVLRRVANNGKN